jgi:hypothetical protein
LGQGENFADPELLMATEQQLAGWRGSFIIQTWNPPWLLSLLLPYTLFPFRQATWLWFLTNIVLVVAASVLTWKACAGRPSDNQRAWIAPLVIIFFIPTLNALYSGQVNTFVLFGLAAALFFQTVERRTLAGAALALTMVKPHLVYITVPILLLQAVSRRQWRFVVGFGGVLVLLSGVALLLRPSFPAEYASTTAGGDLLRWLTPTLGGFLQATLGWGWAKFIGVIVLPAAIWLWWRNRDSVSQPVLVHLTSLVSVATAPFGWGYDAIVLLIPILQIVVWTLEEQAATAVAWLLFAALVLIAGLAFYHRMVMQSEYEAFWIPLAVTAVYLAAYHTLRNRKGVAAQEVAGIYRNQL